MVDERKDEVFQEADDVRALVRALCVFLLDGGEQRLVEHVFGGAQGLSGGRRTLMDSFWSRGSSCKDSRYEDSAESLSPFINIFI